MKKLKTLLLIILCLTGISGYPQNISKEILTKQWDASWITVPDINPTGYVVCHFRKVLDLKEVPERFIVHVSGDNRFKLYVNESLVSSGPAHGDLLHWKFETVDIGPFLHSGKNIIASTVWNFGEYRAENQISNCTAFIVQGNSSQEQCINTNSSWKCLIDSAYSPIQPDLVDVYYAAGPGEKIDMRKFPSGWETNGFDDSRWKIANEIMNGLPKGVFAFPIGWMLVPDNLPPMQFSPQRIPLCRESDGTNIPKGFPFQKEPFTIPSHTTLHILLDQSFLTTAYPVLIFNKGKNAALSLRYAEGLYENENSGNWKLEQNKGNRNDIKEKRFVGIKDELISNGANDQIFTPLWWRTYRYIELQIKTSDEPLTINDIYGNFTAYPLQKISTADVQDTLLKNILDIGWRTARLCASETYMDCPYYEQLQYVGDTRIQALVTMFNCSDDRLVRNAISQINDSRIAEGITLSRYPSAHPQEIPPFSLWWVAMVHDYWMYRTDSEFVQSMLPGIRQVISFFERYQQSDGSLSNPPYWEFSDWANGKGWFQGQPPIGKNENSSILDFQLLLAFQAAADLENKLGNPAIASQYLKSSELLKNTIKKKYWSDQRQLFADVPEKTLYSQHANVFAVLTGLVSGDSAARLIGAVLKDSSLTQGSIYFKFYLNQAVTKAGLGDNYLNLLDIWKENIALGLTTWAETSDVSISRSDCHAWGCSPNIEFYRIVLGINSCAPGFRKVKIEPHLGRLNYAKGSIPHPNGEIGVSYLFQDEKWTIKISLPKDVSGVFVWKGKTYPLKTGVEQEFRLQ